MLILSLAATLTSLTSCEWEDFGSGARYSADFHHTYPLQPGGRISLENFNGSVEISGWDQDSADISGQKYARSPELRDAIKIDIVASGDSIRVRTIRPSGERGNMGATYVIKAPKRIQLDRIVSSNGPIRLNDIQGTARLRTSNGGVRTINLDGTLEAQTSNGGVDVQNLQGDAVLRTSNGRVKAEGVRGSVEATTSNGGIHVQIVEPEPGRAIKMETSNGGVDLVLNAANAGDVRISTSNGGITLRLPASSAFRVKASTSNSSITTEFDVKAEGPVTKNHLEGAVGAGGPLLDLRSSNGSIRLLKM